MRFPKLVVFDLDACLWSPEMFELSERPTSYDAKAGGVVAGRDVVKLFPGALAVLRRLRSDPQLQEARVAVASSTTEPAYANRCLDVLWVDEAEGLTVGEMIHDADHRQIYPGNKGRQHFPALQKASGVAFSDMMFFDDCTYGDNCGDVASRCPGVTCVRTPEGMTEALFQAGLDAFAAGKTGVVA
tara:strand:+ start:43 stop:600 length:558 start_codon:yes stop_codon:yes gene_type:complete